MGKTIENLAKICLQAMALSMLLATAAHARLSAEEIADRASIIEYAAYTGDKQRLSVLSAELAAESARGDLAQYVHYYAALAAYRAAELADVDGYEFSAMLEHCVDQARAAIKLDPEFSEAFALSGACHGLAAAKQPIFAVLAATLSGRHLAKARELAPENPRVLLLSAITALRRHGEAATGLARQQLSQASVLFSEFAADEGIATAQWGEVDTHVWLGRLNALAQQKASARDHYEQALLLAPHELAMAELRDL